MTEFKPTRGETGYLRIEQRIADTPIYIELLGNGQTGTGIFDPADAPAIALAILEAAGVIPVEDGEHHAGDQKYLQACTAALKAHVRVTAAQAAAVEKEAEDRAKLETEAAALFDTYRKAGGHFTMIEWRSAPDSAKTRWLAVAKAAREANK